MLRKALPGLLVAVLAAPAAAQTVDEVIAKSLEARGGLDKLKAVQSIRMTGQDVHGADGAAHGHRDEAAGQLPGRHHRAGHGRRPGLRRRHRLGHLADGHRPARAPAGRGGEGDGGRRPTWTGPSSTTRPRVTGRARRQGEGRRPRRVQARDHEEGRRRRAPLPRRGLVPAGAGRGQAHDPRHRDRGREHSRATTGKPGASSGRTPSRTAPRAVPRCRASSSRRSRSTRQSTTRASGCPRRRRRSRRGTDARRGVLAGSVAGRAIRIARAPRVCSVCGRRAPAGGPT